MYKLINFAYFTIKLVDFFTLKFAHQGGKLIVPLLNVFKLKLTYSTRCVYLISGRVEYLERRLPDRLPVFRTSVV